MSVALVTGGTGFVGAHLVRRLARRGMAVHVVRRRNSDPHRLDDIRARITWHTADLADRSAVQRTVRRVRPDYIFHLAAAAMRGGRASGKPDAVMTATLLGTVNLIDACADIPYRCFVHTGDAFEYAPRAGALAESAACRPTTVDGIAKLAATLYALAAARHRAQPISVVRPFSIFGPLDHPDRLIPQLLSALRTGAPMALSAPEIGRDFLYVADLVDFYVALIRQPRRAAGEVFNAGSGKCTTLGALARTAERIAGARLRARWGAYPTAPHDTERRRADIAKARRLLGWRPRTSLAQGLAAAFAAARRLDDYPQRGSPR